MMVFSKQACSGDGDEYWEAEVRGRGEAGGGGGGGGGWRG